MEPTKNRKKRRTRNSLTKKEILDAASKIIEEEGVEKLSIRKITHELQCSVASPYAHFKNFEEIIEALILQGEDILIEMLKAAAKKSDDNFQQVADLARAYWEFAQKYKELHKLMFITGPIGTIHQKALNVAPRSYRIFLNTLKKGFVNGTFRVERKDYPAFARTMWSWIYGLMILDLTGVLQTKHSENSPLEEGIQLFLKSLT